MSYGIFGYTGKIPDPRFVYNTTYPNRHRGTDWSIPRFGLPFQENPMAKPPFAGLGGCGCGGMQKVGGAATEDFSGYSGGFGDVPATIPAYIPMLVIGAWLAGTAALVWKFGRMGEYDSSKKDW